MTTTTPTPLNPNFRKYRKHVLEETCLPCNANIWCATAEELYEASGREQREDEQQRRSRMTVLVGGMA